MLDQLRRLVGSSSNGQSDGIPPSGNVSAVRQSRNHGQPSASSRSGSLSRLTAYSLHPQHSNRLRMQLSYVPVSYGPPVVAYGRSGRPVVGYDPWYQVRYQQPLPPPPRTPVGRHMSARPDLAPPPPPPSTTSGGKKKPEKERSKDVFHHPTVRRDTVAAPPNSRNRLVSSRSLDSIHPHRIHPPKEKPAPPEVEVKSSSKKVKDFFQRVKDSVSIGASQSNRSGHGQRTDEWLLLRPSVANSNKPLLPPPPRPTTPGLAAFRKIFSRSPSPTPLATSTPIKRPLSSTKSLFQQIIRPRSRSVSSTASLSVRSQSTHSGGIRTKMAMASTTDLSVVNPAGGGTQRGHPDGATFPRDLPNLPMESSEIYAPASEPVQPTIILPSSLQAKRPKFVKKIDQQPAFRVRRRQSQLRRSERKRRSSRRRSGRKKNRSAKKLGSSKGSQMGSQSALSGAKLVSDWTYLPLPTSFTPAATVEEPAPVKKEEEPTVVVDQDDGWESDLYQVLVDRPRRTLPPPMWDPLIFIPPERRRSTVINGSSILSDLQPWIRSSKLRADGKKQLRRINPPLSPSSSRSASSGKASHITRNHYTLHLARNPDSKKYSCVVAAAVRESFFFPSTFFFLNFKTSYCLPADRQT